MFLVCLPGSSDVTRITLKVSHAVACTGVISGILALNLADPVAVGFKAWVCSLLIAGIAGLNPAERCSSLVLVACCVGSGLCDEPITPSEESYRVCVCLCYLDASSRRRRPGSGCCAMGKGEGEEFELNFAERILYLRIYQT